MATKIYGEVYEVVRGISLDDDKERHEAGEVVKLARPWDVSGLLAKGAIKPTKAEPAELEVADDGNGQDE